MGALSVPSPHTPLNNGALLSKQTKLPLREFLVVGPLTSVPSIVSLQTTVLLSLGLSFQPHALALQPCQLQWTLIPGRGAQG